MLRKALKIMEKRLQVLKVLKVPKVPIVKCAEVPKVPIVKCAEVPSRCQTGAEVPSRCRGARVLGASTYPLAKFSLQQPSRVASDF